MSDVQLALITGAATITVIVLIAVVVCAIYEHFDR